MTNDAWQEDRDHTAGEGHRRPLRQRRQEGGRPHKHTVRLSDAEQDIIAARAAEAGVSVPRFLAEAGLAGEAGAASERRAAAAELLAVRRMLATVGGALDQLSATAGATSEAHDARAMLHTTERILARLDELTAAYGHLGLPDGLRPERGHAADDPAADGEDLVDVDVEGVAAR
ncbi:plasmid mobilization protein [Sphaerisporangium rhizosphaerae]|uniref:Plasmid mobilization relaxosome protein MobC n=1 Tax=Sphaerisporangium rhizosphaerae TaxID=2269375 RepID=A0ABW2PCM2_9ACTN